MLSITDSDIYKVSQKFTNLFKKTKKYISQGGESLKKVFFYLSILKIALFTDFNKCLNKYNEKKYNTKNKSGM